MINRRFFLFGAAASIAACRASLACDIIEEIIVPQISYPRFFTEITVASTAHDHGIAQVMLGLGDDDPFIEFAIGPGCWYRWASIPGDQSTELVDSGHKPLALEVIGGGQNKWDVDMFFRDQKRSYMERYEFRMGQQVGAVKRVSMT